MADIKTKDVLKGTIKTLDKASITVDKMKHSYVTTKTNVEKTVNSDEYSAEEYTANRLSESSTSVAKQGIEGIHQLGDKSIKATTEHLKGIADYRKEVTEGRAQGIQNFKMKRAEASLGKQSEHNKGTTIRILERTEKGIKQSSTSTSGKAIKKGKGAVKGSSKSLKTAENTSKIAIKTTDQTLKSMQKATKDSTKVTKRAIRLGRRAAIRIARTAKLVAKATIATIKGIIAGTKALVTAIAAGGWGAVLVIVICVLLGSAVALFGGGSENSGHVAVSEAVEAYTPLITTYAKEYDVLEYVELIKAVMMQESGGRGNDPMQASENGFNTKYPREPNAIQDPDYSVRCGVQALKSVLVAAEVESPVDMERIKLALQGYNFGNGYITWAIENYEGYSYANAVEFSEIQAEKLGWDGYGDTQYVSHVLRYYPYGRAFTEGSNQMIVEVALTQLGNVGGEPYWSWYGYDGRVEWCACFVSWCAEQCGYIESGIIPKYASCNEGAAWFKSNNQWLDRNAEPVAGMIIFFD